LARLSKSSLFPFSAAVAMAAPEPNKLKDVRTDHTPNQNLLDRPAKKA